jgi:DNA-directed RNA polymerase specialized sigma24 family protein
MPGILRPYPQMPALRDIADLLVATQSQVRSYIAALGVASADVDDIAQEVYLAHARTSAPIPAGVEELRWLKGIARNLANNHFRRQTRRGQALGQLADVLEAAPVWLPESGGDEQAAALDRCLGQLSSEHRDLVRRYYGQDEEAGVLAAASSRSVDGIRRLMMKLRRDLRTCVEHAVERGGERSTAPGLDRGAAGRP